MSDVTWNFWSSYFPPHISVSVARFTGRNSAQPWVACFSTSGQHVHGAFRTKTPRHSSRRFKTEIMKYVCRWHSRGCKERLSEKKLTEFLNELDDSHNIKFTYEVEQGGQLPFLDLLLNRTENDGLKLQIYRKPTHTDQYLNFSSHHPIEHKLSVVRTLLERSQCLVTEIEDRKQEDFYIEKALRIRSGLSTKWGARFSPRGTRRPESNVILRSGQWSLFLMWKTFLKP